MKEDERSPYKPTYKFASQLARIKGRAIITKYMERMWHNFANFKVCGQSIDVMSS